MNIIMLNVIMLSVIILGVIMLSLAMNVIMPSVLMLSVLMLSVIMLNDIILSFKTFTNVHIKLVFVPGNPFQPSLMFVGKMRAFLNEAHFKCSTQG